VFEKFWSARGKVFHRQEVGTKDAFEPLPRTSFVHCSRPTKARGFNHNPPEDWEFTQTFGTGLINGNEKSV